MTNKCTPGPYSIHPYSTPEETYCAAGEGHGGFHYASLGIGAGNTLIGEVRMQRPDIEGDCGFPSPDSVEEMQANAALWIAAPDLLEALHEGRRAIGDHSAPSDCYATGPLTGDPIRDLVQCPACSFIAIYDAALAKARPHA